MNRPVISVIVPIYNTELYLNKCIQSLLDQTYKSLEIILVDDGSDDDSLKICKLFEEKDSRIKVISQENQGLICARKTGIQNATGELVGFVDSDDWIECDMYEQMVHIYEKFECDLISSGIYRDYPDGRSVIACDNYDAGLYCDLEESIYPTMLWDEKEKDYGLYSTLVNKIFKRQILTRVYENINTDVFYGEDSLALYTYCMKIKCLYVLKYPYYHYVIRKGSMCRSADTRLPYNEYLLYSELKKVFMSSDNPYILLKQLKRYILNIVSHTLNVLFDIDTVSFGEWSFPYEELFDSQIVIYGASSCGRALYRKMVLEGKGNHVVAWLDKEPKGKEVKCLHDIEKPNLLANLKYDYVIVAVMEESLANQIRMELTEIYNINNEKIVWGKTEYCSIFDNSILL